jgi:putative hydrolase
MSGDRVARRCGVGVDVSSMTTRDPAGDLRQIAYLLERAHEPTYRVRAFRNAAAVVGALSLGELESLAAAGRLTALAGVGDATARCVAQSLAGQVPDYLATALQRTDTAWTEPRTGESIDTDEAKALRALLRGDCHTHSDWSDGGSPIAEMATAGRELGHDYMVLTDHSPRLKVARGLTAERLRAQLDEVHALESFLTPFRLLTGIEVDILDDGALDQSDALLSELDLVVASVHSKLRMSSDELTPRLIAAVANRHTDVLGHCTGRLVTAKGRPESTFDAELVFAACAQFGVAVEINSRPERLDPPMKLLGMAIEAGCLFSIDTDAHAPGQLEWQMYGCFRAVTAGVPDSSIVNTWAVGDLLAWTADHNHRPSSA